MPDRAVRDVRSAPFNCFRESQIEKERFVAEVPHDARLHALHVPTLVVFGEHDGAYRAVDSCARYAEVPGVTVKTIAGVWHSPMLEDPARSARLLMQFIDDL